MEQNLTSMQHLRSSTYAFSVVISSFIMNLKIKIRPLFKPHIFLQKRSLPADKNGAAGYILPHSPEILIQIPDPSEAKIISNQPISIRRNFRKPRSSSRTQIM